MSFRHSTRSVTTWIAMFAILLGALAPALSHALSQPGNGKRMVQVCTVAGMKMVAVDDAAGQGKTDDASLFPAERCPFCATHANLPALPSSPLPPFALSSGAGSFPSLFFSAPQPLFVWAASQPRAPPLRHV